MAPSDFLDNSGVPNLAGLKPQHHLGSLFKHDFWLHSNDSAFVDPERPRELIFTNTPNMTDGPGIALGETGETLLSLEKAQFVAETGDPFFIFSWSLSPKAGFSGLISLQIG